MKLITKVKSVSDVITNSSSEVFVMTRENADYYTELEGTCGCISAFEIDWGWLEKEGRHEVEMICDVIDVDIKELESETFYYVRDEKWYFAGWHGSPTDEDWKTFLEKHKDVIEKKLIGMYWVDIEDHFEDAFVVTENARCDSIWRESRH